MDETRAGHQSAPPSAAAPDLSVELADGFWAPRLEQLRTTTLPTIWDRLEDQGVIGNFRRLAGPDHTARRAMHFSDSDLYKWMEAAALAGVGGATAGHLAEAVELVERTQSDDGYVGTYYGHPGLPDRYTDLTFGHEQYCLGHLIEAAVSHHRATGSEQLLEVARRAADHLLATFGPGGDERTDAHPEIELALCRLAAETGEERYRDHAAWVVEQQLTAAGVDLDSFELGGHAVRALYLTSAIAEVALATGDPRWRRSADRLFTSLLTEHSYPTGAVGGRWLGEAVGRPYELPDAAAYAESCAAVAAAQLAWRMWHLERRTDALDHLEILWFNAVPCGVGADGASWFYSQPQAVDAVAAEQNPWVYDFDYGQLMLRKWFPARRHRWFDVPCCPPNLARAFASVPSTIAEIDGSDLLVHLPVACRLRGGGWDVTVGGGYPETSDVTITVDAAPGNGRLRVRRPPWTGRPGHHDTHDGERLDLATDPAWWRTNHRVEGGPMVHVRRGPVVCCLEGVDHDGLDLRDLVVDTSADPMQGFRRRPPEEGLHRPVLRGGTAGALEPTAVTLRPYATWANRGATTLRTRFPRTGSNEDG